MYIPPPPSPEAEELGGHLTDVINAYQADHPHMSPLDVRQALKLAQRGLLGGQRLAMKAVLLGVVVMLGVGVFLVLSPV